MSHHAAASSSSAMPPPSVPVDDSLIAMVQGNENLDKIKHLANSETIELIQEELSNTGERGWQFMSKRRDGHGVLWTRRICQELLDVRKDTWKLKSLETTVKQFRALLCKHISTVIFIPFNGQVHELVDSVSDEVKCLKLSLLNLTIVDVEALWEELDNDGMKMNIVHSYVMQVAALSHAIRSVQADPEHDVEQLALLNKQIHERVKLISNQVLGTLGRIWFDYWNHNVTNHRLTETLRLVPGDKPGGITAAHSLARSHHAFIPVPRNSRFRSF